MNPSRSRLLFIAAPLLIAAAIETVTWNTVPIDVGYPPGTPWYIEFYGSCYAWLHAPAFLVLDGIHWHDALLWFLSGWFTTFCGLLLLMIVFRFLRNRRSVPIKTAGGQHP